MTNQPPEAAGGHVHDWAKATAGWWRGLPEWWQVCKTCGKDRVMPR